MTNTDQAVLTVFGGVAGLGVSCVLAAMCGREWKYALWGLIGPIGWAVAAVHGAEDRLHDRLARALPAGGASRGPTHTAADGAAGFVEHPCPSCGKPMRYPTSEEGKRVPCVSCGTQQLFGPAA